MAASCMHGMQLKPFVQLGDTVLCSLRRHWQTVKTEITFRTIVLAHVEKSHLESVQSLLCY